MSFTAESRERSRPVLPLAAMVDIMFLLLVFFITTSVLREQELVMDVNLQSTTTGRSGESRTAIKITIKDDGSIYIGEKAYTADELRRTLAQIAQQFPNESVIIRGDKNSDLGTTILVMDICKSVGLTNVGLGSTQQAGEL